MGQKREKVVVKKRKLSSVYTTRHFFYFMVAMVSEAENPMIYAL